MDVWTENPFPLLSEYFGTFFHFMCSESCLNIFLLYGILHFLPFPQTQKLGVFLNLHGRVFKDVVKVFVIVSQNQSV